MPPLLRGPSGTAGCQGSPLKGRHLEVTLLMPRGYSTLSPTGPNPTALYPKTASPPFHFSQSRGHTQSSPIPVSCVQQQPVRDPQGGREEQGYLFQAGILLSKPPSWSLQLRDTQSSEDLVALGGFICHRPDPSYSCKACSHLAQVPSEVAAAGVQIWGTRAAKGRWL